MRRTAFSLAILAASALHGAQAYEPESGIWWNPTESGTGYAIEIQDDMMAVTVYGGSAGGYAKWYTSAGRLQGNAYFEADLLGFDHVQPIGGIYAGFPTLEPGYGRLKIVFDANDNRRATLTWPNGRSIPIQRQEFYFVRPEDAAGVDSNTLKMLGEWQIVADISSDQTASYPFTADILVLDDYGYDSGLPGWTYEGCRPDDGQVGGCSTYALEQHDAVGFREAPSTSFPAGVQVVVVKDGYYNGTMWYALYELAIGTNDGSGSFTLYPQGADPYDYPAYPARAFRSASRTFVQEGSGPAKRAGTAIERDGGLAATLNPQPTAAKSAELPRAERIQRLATIRALEARLAR